MLGSIRLLSRESAWDKFIEPAPSFTLVFVILFDQVSLSFDESDVLSNLNFEIAPRSFQFLTGSSGAGKTSLLNLINMNLQPSTGMIKLFNRDARSFEPSMQYLIRRKIGTVYQDFRLLDHLTLFENISLPMRVRGKRLDLYEQDALELLDWVGLGDSVHLYPPSLSGGEQQRAAIARAVISKPELLLADEPTGNVDQVLAERILRLFIELNRQGTTVIIATHDETLLAMCEARRLVLERGQLRVIDPGMPDTFTEEQEGGPMPGFRLSPTF